jgi:hypothetical protein
VPRLRHVCLGNPPSRTAKACFNNSMSHSGIVFSLSLSQTPTHGIIDPVNDILTQQSHNPSVPFGNEEVPELIQSVFTGSHIQTLPPRRVSLFSHRDHSMDLHAVCISGLKPNLKQMAAVWPLRFIPSSVLNMHSESHLAKPLTVVRLQINDPQLWVPSLVMRPSQKRFMQSW